MGLYFCSGGYEPEGRITCGRLRALAVRDTASKKPSAAVEMRRARARKAHFGHRKSMVGGSNPSSATKKSQFPIGETEIFVFINVKCLCLEE